MLDFHDDVDEYFELLPLQARLMITDLDLNKHKPMYDQLIADLAAGRPSDGRGESGKACKTSCQGDAAGATAFGAEKMTFDSAYAQFCTHRLWSNPCGPSAGYTAADLLLHFPAASEEAQMVKLPTDHQSTVIPALMATYPLRAYRTIPAACLSFSSAALRQRLSVRACCAAAISMTC
jgi:hypothetical protein